MEPILCDLFLDLVLKTRWGFKKYGCLGFSKQERRYFNTRLKKMVSWVLQPYDFNTFTFQLNTILSLSTLSTWTRWLSTRYHFNAQFDLCFKYNICFEVVIMDNVGHGWFIMNEKLKIWHFWKEKSGWLCFFFTGTQCPIRDVRQKFTCQGLQFHLYQS